MDCSVTASSFLPDENSVLSEKLYSKLEKGLSIWVPAIWWYELNNVLIVAVRRKRINDAKMLEIIDLFQSMPISIDDNFTFNTLKNINNISLSHNLSVYDAAYIELAKRKNAGIATLDDKILIAAKKEKIFIFE